MNERGTRPSVNRKTIYEYVRQKITYMVSLNLIIDEYEEMVKIPKEKLGIFPTPIKPENIKLS